jgi:hypothetical protein
MQNQHEDDGSSTVAISRTTGMTQGQLFSALNRLELPGTEHLTSRYKPLALLWWIGRMAVGKSRLIKWSEFREGMPTIQQRYGRPLPIPDPQYPFWDLRTSGFWEVVGIEDHPNSPYTPKLAILESENPSAGFTTAADVLLRDARVRDRVVRALVDRFFSDVDQATLLADLRLPNSNLTSGFSPTEVEAQEVGISEPRKIASPVALSPAKLPVVSQEIEPLQNISPVLAGQEAAQGAIIEPDVIGRRPVRKGDAAAVAIAGTPAGGKQGRQQDAVANRAIELHAEDLAEKYFEKRGWVVERVGNLKLGFDLDCCHLVEGVLHVEVKGTQTRGEEVILTHNEVRHNLNVESCGAAHALFVVSEIQVERASDIRCFGGREYCLWPWSIDDSLLTPTQYRYQLPQPFQIRAQLTKQPDRAGPTNLVDGNATSLHFPPPNLSRARVDVCAACGVVPSSLGLCRCS